MHAELSRFVTRRRDDAACLRSADRDRLPSQLRIIPLLHRRVERPFALVGGVVADGLDAILMSVAVGFIALAGVAAETGVVMLIYLDHALTETSRMM
jgi:hypothetical protein